MIGLAEKDRQAVYIYIKKKLSLSLTILRFITQIFIEADRLQHVFNSLFENRTGYDEAC